MDQLLYGYFDTRVHLTSETFRLLLEYDWVLFTALSVYHNTQHQLTWRYRKII